MMKLGKMLAWGWLGLLALIVATGFIKLLIASVEARRVTGGMVAILITVFCISYLDDCSRRI